MAFAVKVLPQYELSVLNYSGLLSAEDFDGVWAAMAASPGFRPHFDNLLVLGPDCTHSDLAYEVIKAKAAEAGTILRGPEHEGPRSHACVCANDMQVAMTRLFGAIARANGDTRSAAGCFKQLGPALAWLEARKGGHVQIDRDVIHRVLVEMGPSWCFGDEAAASSEVLSPRLRITT